MKFGGRSTFCGLAFASLKEAMYFFRREYNITESFHIPSKCIGKEVAMKYFPPLILDIKSLLVGVSKLINWCVGVLFLQRVY